ncbi:hypothetical protein BDW68DRAFT_170200 [Aspergillus falconensis]
MCLLSILGICVLFILVDSAMQRFVCYAKSHFRQRNCRREIGKPPRSASVQSQKLRYALVHDSPHDINETGHDNGSRSVSKRTSEPNRELLY